MKRRLFFLRLPKPIRGAFYLIAEFHQQLTIAIQNKYGGRDRTNDKSKPEHRPYLLSCQRPDGIPSVPSVFLRESGGSPACLVQESSHGVKKGYGLIEENMVSGLGNFNPCGPRTGMDQVG